MATSPTNNTCLLDEICCGDPTTECCDPATECCDGTNCQTQPTCDECQETLNLSTCNCDVRDNGCAKVTEFPCGDGCCNAGDICASCVGGVPNCIPA